MIQSISLINSNGEILEIPLVGATSLSPLMVVNIEGIGAPEATINSLGFATHGARFNSSKVNIRDINMQLVVQTHGSAEEAARRSLYNWLPTSKPVIFRVSTDEKEMEIDARIRQNNINMFAKMENAEIGLECTNPFFRSVDLKSVIFGGTISLFTFPFSNDSLTEDLIIFGEELSYIALDVQYDGHIETGIDILLHFIGPVTGYITVYNTSHNQLMSIDTEVIEDILGSSITLGDEIRISTKVGEKSVLASRAGISYNALRSLDRHPQWVDLRPGKNTIVYTADTGQDNIQMRLSYHELYMGV